MVRRRKCPWEHPSLADPIFVGSLPCPSGNFQTTTVVVLGAIGYNFNGELVDPSDAAEYWGLSGRPTELRRIPNGRWYTLRYTPYRRSLLSLRRALQTVSSMSTMSVLLVVHRLAVDSCLTRFGSGWTGHDRKPR